MVNDDQRLQSTRELCLYSVVTKRKSVKVGLVNHQLSRALQSIFSFSTVYSLLTQLSLCIFHNRYSRVSHLLLSFVVAIMPR